jgi:hypothetical protein
VRRCVSARATERLHGSRGLGASRARRIGVACSSAPWSWSASRAVVWVVRRLARSTRIRHHTLKPYVLMNQGTEVSHNPSNTASTIPPATASSQPGVPGERTRNTFVTNMP